MIHPRSAAHRGRSYFARRHLHGFTFIELAIATTIFSIIAVSLYSAFSVGVKMWQRGAATVDARQSLFHFFRFFETDLTGAMAYTPTGINFQGDGSRVSFMAIVPVNDDAGNRRYGVAKIVYWFDPATKTVNRIVAERTEGLDEKYGVSADLLQVTSGDVSFEYCFAPVSEDGDFVWKSKWPDETKVPIGVRVHALGYTKYVVIPVGVPGSEK